MPALEAMRDRTVDVLGRHFALGHLSEATLEHRVAAALAAHTAIDLHDLTWDLPALRRTLRDWARALIDAAGDRRCTRISFPGLEVTLAVGGAPRTWSLGRSRDCDVVLCDPGVSRRHALISTRGGLCSVLDLGSTNGVVLNGHLVHSAALHPGDELRLGSSVQAIVR